MSEMDTLLDNAQDDAMPLVEWALTPMGYSNPEEEYANVLASTNHLEILCFITGPPLMWLPKPTKSYSDFLYEWSMNILRALTGQSRDSWLYNSAPATVSQISSLQRQRPFFADSSLTPRSAVEAPQQPD